MSDETSTPRPSRIPDFQSIEEEAEWWDTHDFTDYLDELRPVRLEVSQEFRDRVAARAAANPIPSWPVHVHVDLADRPMVEECARKRGLTPATLIQLWVDERLDQIEKEHASSAGSVATAGDSHGDAATH